MIFPAYGSGGLLALSETGGVFHFPKREVEEDGWSWTCAEGSCEAGSAER